MSAIGTGTPGSGPAPWDAGRLEADRVVAVAAFRQERFGEPLERYLDYYRAARQAMERLLDLTADLRLLAEHCVEVISDPELMHSARHLASPPISVDDLVVLADTTVAPTVVRAEPERAERLVGQIVLGFDRERFPWVAQGRGPTAAERETAVVAAAAMRAFRQVETWRRNQGKKRQEDRVREFLAEECGLSEAPARPIDNLHRAPEPGQFCAESLVGTRRADIPVRLWDGRIMPIECKVSNSGSNSYKRINNDAAVKAVVWNAELGSANCIPAAVLSGVFVLANLQYAQAKGLALYWEHDLSPLRAFIATTR
jgi:hypothetical protein